MKYIVSGGGTGGHIYPALAIVKEIQKRDENAVVLYVGKKGSLEEELVIKENINFKSIDIAGLPRKKISKDTIITFYQLLKGLRECDKIVKDFKPDVVIGTGGYVCAPVLLKAQQKNIKTVIQEQNAFPGKTNKLLARKADLVAINFDEARKYLNSQKIIYTGNPLREEFQEDNIKKLKEAVKSRKQVLSFGGSGGQESTNEAIIEIIKAGYEIDFDLVHVTGKTHYDKFLKDIEGLSVNKNIKILDYSYDVAKLLANSDLVIASSSAMTLAEISAVGLASILIPKSYTAGNHQVFNAKSYEDKNSCKLILEENLTGEVLYNNIIELLADDEKRLEMANNSKKLGNKDAVKILVNEIEKLIK